MIPYRDSNPSGTKPVVTIAIIAVNLVVFLYEIGLGDGLDRFILHQGLVPGIVTGRYPIPGWGITDSAWRFVTTMFLHAGWFHLIGNMWYLWIFGDNIEDRLGHAGFALFYLVGGVAGSLFHVFASPASLVPTVGASGAIAAVLGAYLICYPRARVKTFVPLFFVPLFFDFPAVFVLGSWFLVQLLSGTASLSVGTGAAGGVAWWAHIGGFVVGMALVRVLPARKRRRQHAYVVPFDRHAG